MGKLIKYEIRKQLMSKIVLLGVLVVLQALLLLGVFLKKPDWAATAVVIFYMTAFASLFYFSFESIITFSNDLKTKQSYMLFLLPRNMFQIVGAKMLTAVIQIIGVGLVFMVVGIGNMFFIMSRNGKIEMLVNAIKKFIQNLTSIEIRLSDVVCVILLVLTGWLLIVLLAMFSITLSSTLLANKKYKGVLSVVIFFGLSWLEGKIEGLVCKDAFLKNGELLTNTQAWAGIGLYIAMSLLVFLGTALLLEKKVSV